ncbi:MAG: hypothetical protein ACT4QD_11210 [Acidobacteriota bacterium]
MPELTRLRHNASVMSSTRRTLTPARYLQLDAVFATADTCYSYEVPSTDCKLSLDGINGSRRSLHYRSKPHAWPPRPG